MTVADHAPPTIDPIVESLLSFDPQTGKASGHLVELLRQLRDYNLGGSRIIPCDGVITSNVVTLSPNNPVSPIIESYAEHDIFSAVVSGSSTSSVTATVVDRSGGNLPTINVYKSNGGTQAGNGDLVSGRHYTFTYVSSLNSGNGGFVIR